MPSPLFTGPASLRDPGERVAFWLTLLFAFPAAGVLGFFIHETVGASEVALFIVIAMIYVTLARGRLLGSSVRIHESQYPRVFAIVKRTCAALEIPMPLIFVREDYFVPVAALGFGEPYSLVISSHWIEQFQDDELAFVIGRQLGHIASGHTRYLSLLSVNGNENPIIALIFGAWLRRCDLTCDKIGLLVCGSLESATRAVAVSSFHHFGRKVDLDQFAEQGREVNDDSVLRWGEWLSSEPYATKRIAWMRHFIASHVFAVAEEWFLREVNAEPPALPLPGTTKVLKADCAGRWRRLVAFGIDSILVLAIMGAVGAPSFIQKHATAAHASKASSAAAIKALKAAEDDDASDNSSKTRNAQAQSAAVIKALKATDDDADDTSDDSAKKGDSGSTPVWVLPFGITFTPANSGDPASEGLERFLTGIGFVSFPVLLSTYLCVLVALAGQTFGMMIAGLRVVTIDYKRASITRTIFRYGIFFFLGWLIVPFAFFSRILLHDKLTKTRLVTTERVMARVVAASHTATA